LRNIRADLARVDGKVDTLRADIAAVLIAANARIDAGRKETIEQIAGLRRAVVEYHSAVLGRRVLTSELEARARRMEQRLGRPEMGRTELGAWKRRVSAVLHFGGPARHVGQSATIACASLAQTR
jgi:hypothetical protein